MKYILLKIADAETTAYNIGYLLGKIFAIVLIICLIVWAIKSALGKK